MANLIITIISIALVAIAALMGAYYGGAAFFTGSTKAIANTIVSQASQINAAIQIWAMQRGGNFSLPGSTTGYAGPASYEDLTPELLSSWPVVPREHMLANGSFWDGKYNWMVARVLEGDSTLGSTITNPNSVLLGFAQTDVAFSVCSEAYRIANGFATGDGVPRSPSDGYIYHRAAGLKAACYWRDTDDDGVYDIGGNTGTWFVFWFD